MIITKDSDNMLYINDSLEEAEIEFEIDTGGAGIDEFTFCDDNGQIYVPQEVEKKVFKLVPKGKATRENLISFIKNVVGFGSIPKGIETLDDLKKILSID